MWIFKICIVCSDFCNAFVHQTGKIGDNSRILVNHNKLLKSYDGCIGVKTGFTKKSGRCLVSAATRDAITLIAVTLDDPNDWNDHKSMLNVGFKSLETVSIGSLIDIPDSLPTISSDFARLPIKLSNDTLIKRIDEDPDFSLDLPSYIATDIKAGEKVGTLSINFKDRTQAVDIIAACDVKIKNFKRRSL